MIKVEGYPHLYRDEKTGAIVNCDDIGYDQHIKSLNIRKNQRREINEIKKDIDEIKVLLKLLIDGNNKT
tara:strand:+ start:338 stop:544 length:207 start_codon:yes stop_codon:yes gene_type:complete